MMKKITITRRIQVYLDTNEKEEFKEGMKKIYTWNRLMPEAANMVASQQFFLHNAKHIIGLATGAKKTLIDQAKNETGILDTSMANTTYRMLSTHFKGKCPMGMLSALNTNVYMNMCHESFDVRIGKKSLRSYKRGMPMPIRMGDIREWEHIENGNYTFRVYGLKFRTHFGRDLSGNRQIMQMAMENKVKMCDSSLAIKAKKMFFLAVFQMEQTLVQLNPKRKMTAWLGIEHPIMFTFGGDEYTIGHKEEYLHRRLQIQAGIRRARISCKYNKAGKGRAKKMKSTDRYRQAEKNYVKTRAHQYTSELIKWALKRKCATIELIDKAAEENIKEDEFLLRNWGYYGMLDMLKYKSGKYGIKIEYDEVEEATEEEVLSGV